MSVQVGLVVEPGPDGDTTGHDEANRAAVAAVPRDKLALVGIAMHGPKNAVDKVLKGARMHP